MEKDKASTPNQGKDIHVGSASDIEMATNFPEKLTHVGQMPLQRNDSECCIYRVPRSLRNVDSKAYAPTNISIGPLSRRNERPMDKEKQKYFKKLTERNGMDKKILCDIVINQEERLRHCYSEKSILMESSDDFAKMILLDAVFIIQFFLESNDDTDGPKNFESRMTYDIREDLMLLENQLPLFIIEKIYDQVNPRGQDSKPIPFLDLATCHLRKYLRLQEEETSPRVQEETSPGVEGSRHFTDLLRNLMLCKTISDVEIETSSDGEKETSLGVEGSRHFTDLLRNLMLSGANKPSYSFNPLKLKYSAVRLHKAGVKFQVITEDKCLVNITFHRGVLKIPKLEVDHNFERLVRNIMAMEQCLYKSKAYICSYIKFMDHLIDSAEDVGLLVENGIILHSLGNDVAVSDMINNFCKNIDDKYTCFGDISKALNAHYERPWNHSKATLKLVYFPDIWRGTGTVAAAILLILTLMQTIKAFL